MANTFKIRRTVGYQHEGESSHFLTAEDAARTVARLYENGEPDVTELALHYADCEECGWASNPTPERKDAKRHGEQHVRSEHGTPDIDDAAAETVIEIEGVSLPIRLTPQLRAAIAAAKESDR